MWSASSVSMQRFLGTWRDAGIVVAGWLQLAGQTMTIKLDPGKCKAEAEAVEALVEVNSKLCRGVGPATLAKPSPESCADCPLQTICPAFWEAIEQRGLDEDRAAAAVEVVQIEVGHDDDLYTTQVPVVASSCPTDRDQTVVLRCSVHGDLPDSGRHARWRAVLAAMRADRRLRADFSTVVFPKNGIPRIVVASDGK